MILIWSRLFSKIQTSMRLSLWRHLWFHARQGWILDVIRLRLASTTMKNIAQKYGFSDQFHVLYAITSARGTKYTSLDDLSGKTTGVLHSSNYAQLLESEPPVTRHQLQSTTLLAQRILSTLRVQHIQEGKIDFILYDALRLIALSKIKAISWL